MYRITHFIALGSPDVPELVVHCDKLPVTPEAFTATLEAALDLAAGVAGGKAVRILGVVVPVMSAGPPEQELAAAIAWATLRGRMRPIDEFEYGAATDLQPIVDRLTTPKPEMKVDQARATSGGLPIGL